jgi:hypothetical protein
MEGIDKKAEKAASDSVLTVEAGKSVQGNASYDVINDSYSRAERLPEEDAPVGNFECIVSGEGAPKGDDTRGFQYQILKHENGVKLFCNVANLKADGCVTQLPNGKWQLTSEKIGWKAIKDRKGTVVDVKFLS